MTQGNTNNFNLNDSEDIRTLKKDQKIILSSIKKVSLFESVLNHLDQGKLLRDMSLNPDDLKLLYPLFLITLKPVMYVANVNEGGFENNQHLENVIEYAKNHGSKCIPICAKIESEIADLTDEEQQRVGGFGLLSLTPILVVYNTSEEGIPIGPVEEQGGDPLLLVHGKIEMEIAQLPPEDEGDFLAEYGISEPGRERVIRASYDTLGLLTFFTGNDEEARAWTLRRGSTCLEAADTIHSDMARGFIRAEVIAWDELVALGSLADARAQGKLRVEGKEYIVSDGDVLYIRFNV